MIFLKQQNLVYIVICKISVVVFINLTVVLVANLNKVQAQQQYYDGTQEVSQNEYQASVLVNQSVAMLRDNHNQEAVNTLEEAVKLGPNLAIAHYNLGIAYSKNNQFEPAIVEFKKSISLNPNYSSAWLCLGGVLQSSGHLNECIETYKQYLIRFPSDKSVEQVKKLISGLQNESLVEANNKGSNKSSNYLSEIPVDGRNRWTQSAMPLKVYIQDGTGLKGYDRYFKATLIESFQDYQQALNGLLRFKFSDSPNSADIICFWSDDLDKFKDGAEAGKAQISRSNDGIIHATIEFLTLPLSNTPPLTKNRLQAICLHEIGHALGIGGHSSNPQDIMYFSMPLTDEPKDLSNRDINTLKLLYQVN